MTVKLLKDAMERVETWPQEAKEELAEIVLEIDAGLQGGVYHATAEELAGVDRGPNPHVGKPVKTAPIYDDKEITKALAIIASDTCTGSIEEEIKEHHGALAAAVYRAAWDAGLCEGWDIGRDSVLHSDFDAGMKKQVRRKAG